MLLFSHSALVELQREPLVHLRQPGPAAPVYANIDSMRARRTHKRASRIVLDKKYVFRSGGAAAITNDYAATIRDTT